MCKFRIDIGSGHVSCHESGHFGAPCRKIIGSVRMNRYILARMGTLERRFRQARPHTQDTNETCAPLVQRSSRRLKAVIPSGGGCDSEEAGIRKLDIYSSSHLA